jgi:hypothetical protein
MRLGGVALLTWVALRVLIEPFFNRHFGTIPTILKAQYHQGASNRLMLTLALIVFCLSPVKFVLAFYGIGGMALQVVAESREREVSGAE